MDRWKLAWVMLAVTPLLADGPAPSVEPLEAARPVVEGGAEARLGRPVIEAHLDRLNPLLTPRQRGEITDAVLRYSAEYELDPALVLGVITQESAARPWARSPKGAVGLMQVMPYMMERLDLAGNLTDIDSNIEAGCMILSDNIRRLGERQGVLAYFWGNEIRGVQYWHRVERARARILDSAES